MRCGNALVHYLKISTMMTNKKQCEACGGTGWKSIERNGTSYAFRCDHGTTEPLASAREIARSQAISDLVLTTWDKAIRALVEPRRGRANAIKIEEIGQLLWPDDWAKNRDHVVRRIKESAERLRLFAGFRMVASKSKPYGYFVPATAEEADEYAERMFREGVKLLRLARLFRPDRDWVQEMRGQLQL